VSCCSLLQARSGERRNYADAVRRLAALVSVAFVVLAAYLVLAPFDRPQPSGLSYGAGMSTRCTSPIVGAWRTEHDSGWFGYAPLTSTRQTIPFPTCQGAARHRLALGSLSLVAASLVAFELRRRGRRRTAGVDADASLP
jgi:hypothetical protein